MIMNYTIIAFSENTPGVLYRIADLFLKRKINIESLTVSDTQTDNISRFTLVVNANTQIIERIVKQLYKIVEIIKVFDKTDSDLIFKELAFFKISTKNPQLRNEIEKLCQLFNAKVIYVGKDFLVIEKSGSEETINSLQLILKPYGIIEFVRSGRIAVLKDDPEKQGSAKNITVTGGNKVTTYIEVSAIKRIELLAREKSGVVSLAQGVPSFDTPLYIKEAVKKAMDKNLTDRYTPGWGIDQLRQAVAEKVRKENKIPASSDNVIITHGAIEGLMAVFLALFDPEDEIIVPTPDYASHLTQIIISRSGGKPLFVAMDETKNWQIDIDKITSVITPKTKAILICNPSNPSGKVYSLAELKAIAQIALKYNLFIIVDEIYEYFTYDNLKHISIGSFGEVADRVISIFGVSKSYSMTGWRIGYIVASKQLVKTIFKIHDSLITCPTAASQYAALAAITGNKSSVLAFKKEYEKRRQITTSFIKSAKILSLVKPKGAYYAFIKVNNPIDDYQLAIDLINKAKVALVPGSAFGPGGQNHLRISYCVAEENLIIGLERMVNYFNKNY